MSAITKTHIKFSSAVAPYNDISVQVENIKSIEALDIDAINNNPPEAWILINHFHTTLETRIKFEDSVYRDGALDEFHGEFTTELTS